MRRPFSDQLDRLLIWVALLVLCWLLVRIANEHAERLGVVSPLGQVLPDGGPDDAGTAVQTPAPRPPSQR